MELDEIIKAFDAEFGIENVPADDEGAYHLQIEGIGVMIMTVGDGTQLGMFAGVGEPPAEDREVLYRALLEAMAPGGGNEGMTFSIMPSSGRIVLSRIDALVSTDLAAFKDRLERLVNLVTEWRQTIVNLSPLCGKVREASVHAGEEVRNLRQSGFLQV